MIVEIEGVYLDSNKVRRKQFLVKRVLEYEIEQVLERYGFKKEVDGYVKKDSFVKLKLRFFFKVV